MPVRPNAVERLLLQRLNTVPAAGLDLMAATAYRAAMSAVRLGVLDALAGGPRSAESLAGELALDADTLRRLLDLLAATGYVARRGDRYRLSRSSRRWLVSASPRFVGDFLELWEGLVTDLWDSLDESVRDGRPATHLHDWFARDPRRWARFNRSVAAMAPGPARETARRVALPRGAARLLDVGGNHGHYSVAFCARHPQLTATILDAEEARPAQLPGPAGIRARIGFRAGDLFDGDLDGPYDVVLLANVLHYLDGEGAAKAVESLAACLAPGGVLVVSEQTPAERGRAGAVWNRLLRLNYRVVLGGDVHDGRSIERWCAQAGLQRRRRVRLWTATGQTVFVWARPERG